MTFDIITPEEEAEYEAYAKAQYEAQLAEIEATAKMYAELIADAEESDDADRFDGQYW